MLTDLKQGLKFYLSGFYIKSVGVYLYNTLIINKITMLKRKEKKRKEKKLICNIEGSSLEKEKRKKKNKD